MDLPERLWSRSLVGLAIGIPVSAVFLWLAFRDANLDSVWRALQDARFGLVIAAALMLLAVFAIQAARWRSVSGARHVTYRRQYGMVLSGLACSNVLPIRLGEVLRARWLNVEEPMPGGRALGTVALDRACDVATLALFLGVGLWAVASADWLDRIVVAAGLTLVLVAAALVFARIYSARRPRERHDRRTMRRITRDMLDTLAEPVGRRRAAGWLALSIAAWGLSAVSLLVVGRSLGLELELLDAVFVTAVLSLGTAIPSSPGYVGTYQWLGVASLGLLDVPVDDALAFTILYHATWYVPTTVIGGLILGVRALRGVRA